MPSPRRRRRGRGRRIPRLASLSGNDRVDTVCGKLVVPVTTVSTVPVFSLPLALGSLGPRLATLATVFQEHRFISVTVVLHPGFVATSAVRASYAAGYFKVPAATPPTTLAQVYQAAASRYHDLGDTVPVTLRIPRQTLMNNVRPWYLNASPSGSEVLDSQQGVIYFVPGVASTGLNVNVEISYVVQLRGSTPPGV